MHDEGVLHTHRRAVAGIDTLHFAGHQAISHIAQPRAAVVARRHDAEEAHVAHLVHDLAVEAFLAEGRFHPWHQLVLGKSPGRIADHPLLAAQVAFEVERVFPVERDFGHDKLLQFCP